MQVPVATTSTEFTLGPLQLGPADCMIAVTQQCHNLHRSFDDRQESLLFRCDFLKNEIFAPSAFRVKPPGLLPTFFSVANQTIAADIWNQTTILQNYPVRVFEQSTSHEAFMLAIQVFFLRMLEKLTKNETSILDQKQCLLQRLLATSVDSARMASSPFHFSMFFLEVGRQIEPGSFGKLFPLPSSCWMMGHEEVLDLLEMALDQGALDVATGTLPMLTSQQVTFRYSYHILRELLHKLVRGNGTRPKMGSRLQHEMSIIGDVFRYASKIGNGMVAQDTCTNESSSDDDEEIRRLSALCFLPKIFFRGKGEATIGEAAATFIISGFDDDSSTWSFTSSNEDYQYSATLGSYHDVARCTVDALIEAVLPASDETNWRRGALTARLLLGMESGGTKLTTESRIARMFSSSTCLSSSLEPEMGSVIHFLRREFLECAKQIKPSAASAIADLAVLSCENLHKKQQIPDKIIYILVCLHCSNRSQELLDCLDENTQLNSLFSVCSRKLLRS
ncbi:hypothetical protein FisN_20Lu245 [Fistulifera solaris]|uniref:Uncharacterized protein n=1 Tax=Fistulifera solaris TaxID=1519565 RepID=A0A1Z5KS49_FISSO|nr:hypothetical protein FisN_20Lu245 [Fistulifera solaris]|eukprot:GAX28925.1 hypothetical protein FisN_20Lu245 [Fistulifera solaris]